MAALRWWRADRWRWDDPAPEAIWLPGVGLAVDDGPPPAGNDDGGRGSEPAATPDDILAAFLPGGGPPAEVIDLAVRRAERLRGSSARAAEAAGRPVCS